MLVDIYELLETLFTRNRSQHRRSHWWKSLHAFRKQLALLLNEMEGGRKSERVAKVEARLKFWDEKCVHVWYWYVLPSYLSDMARSKWAGERSLLTVDSQFSQLVAVGSFAMLGLVLMASVARLCRITGITSAYEEIASADIQGVLSASDELALSEEFGGVGDEAEWDEGVVIARED